MKAFAASRCVGGESTGSLVLLSKCRSKNALNGIQEEPARSDPACFRLRHRLPVSCCSVNSLNEEEVPAHLKHCWIEPRTRGQLTPQSITRQNETASSEPAEGACYRTTPIVYPRGSGKLQYSWKSDG